MASITFLSPASQFSGTTRLLNQIRECLHHPDFSQLRIAVAYAKSSPLLKISTDLKGWLSAGKTARAVIGLCQRGTSRQALEIALGLFKEVYVCLPGSAATFHPKFYLFSGTTSATCFVGSHNLTVGGTETNYEAGVRVELDLASDSKEYSQALDCWDALLPTTCSSTKRLDPALLKRLIDAELLFDETKPRSKFSGVGSSGSHKTAQPNLFPVTYPKPPEPLPLVSVTPITAAATTPGKTAAIKSTASIPAAVKNTVPAVSFSDELVIQIVPHHNGEIFLSKKAANQNPNFFGFPFSGSTVPKRPGNASYPQRVPDPLINVTVFNSQGVAVLVKPQFPLNTVYYELKKEIRITVSPDILKVTAEFSILHMRGGDQECDYYFDIYNPGSAQYQALLAVCNQTLPSGGAGKARKMGWL